jgi:hypothetical protein
VKKNQSGIDQRGASERRRQEQQEVHADDPGDQFFLPLRQRNAGRLGFPGTGRRAALAEIDEHGWPPNVRNGGCERQPTSLIFGRPVFAGKLFRRICRSPASCRFARFDRELGNGVAFRMTRLLALLGPLLLLSACANADGSRPRLSPAAAGAESPAGFNGGYAGTNYGFSNLNTKSVPF